MTHVINLRSKYAALLSKEHLELECRGAISPTPLNLRGIFPSFPPFFKSPGAGVAGTLPVGVILVTLIRLLTAMPAPPAPGK